MPYEEYEDEGASTLTPESSVGFGRWVSELAQVESLEELKAFGDNRFAVPPSPEQLLHLRALLIRAYEASCDPSPERWDRIRLGHLALDSQGDMAVEASLKATEREDADTAPEVNAPVISNTPIASGTPALQVPLSSQRQSWHEPPPPTPMAVVTPSATSSQAAPSASPSFDPNAAAETEAIDLDAVARLLAAAPSATPFAKAPGAGLGAPPPPTSFAPHPEAGSTEGLDEAALHAIAASYPLPAAPTERLPLPVEQYAALAVRTEAANSQAELDAVHAEYGIEDAAHRKRLDEECHAVLTKHPPLRAAFDQTVAQWKQHLRRK